MIEKENQEKEFKKLIVQEVNFQETLIIKIS